MGIVGLLNIRSGFGILKNLGRDVGIGYTGATLYFIALILVVLGILLILLGGRVVALIGGIVAIVSDILVGIGFYKLGGIYNEGTTKIGGILVAIPVIWGMILLAIPVLFVSFIGYILVYIGLGKIKPMAMVALPAQPGYAPNSINPMCTPMPPTQPNYPPQIYQEGQGIIRGNGYAQVSLYSTTQATILSARIEGTTLSSVNINPVVLQPGQNEVTIQFGNVSSLTPSTTYLITLVVNIGENMSEVKATAVYQP